MLVKTKSKKKYYSYLNNDKKKYYGYLKQIVKNNTVAIWIQIWPM